MATYVLIHGAGDVGWSWHLVEAELRARGHDVIAPDLPCDDETAGLIGYADTVVAAIDGRTSDELVVVGLSFGGYTAPLVCARLPADLLVLVAGMIPAPGESAAEMFAKTGYEYNPEEDASPIDIFLHDVPRELAEEALSREKNQADRLAQNDRLFPAAWVRDVVRDRLGITPDEIASGHCVSLSKPRELVEILEGYRLSLPAVQASDGPAA